MPTHEEKFLCGLSESWGTPIKSVVRGFRWGIASGDDRYGTHAHVYIAFSDGETGKFVVCTVDDPEDLRRSAESMMRLADEIEDELDA